MKLLRCSVLALLAACGASGDPVRDLEREILAPCCYRQSLEDHESAIASQLRAEIERRVAAGEAPAHIEDSLVARFGPEVHAAPPARGAVLLFVISAMAAGMLLALRLVVRRGARTVAPVVSEAHDLRYGDKLDDELAAFD